jgi:hypothetical protein
VGLSTLFVQQNLPSLRRRFYSWRLAAYAGQDLSAFSLDSDRLMSIDALLDRLIPVAPSRPQEVVERFRHVACVANLANADRFLVVELESACPAFMSDSRQRHGTVYVHFFRPAGTFIASDHVDTEDGLFLSGARLAIGGGGPELRISTEGLLGPHSEIAAEILGVLDDHVTFLRAQDRAGRILKRQNE